MKPFSISKAKRLSQGMTEKDREESFQKTLRLFHGTRMGLDPEFEMEKMILEIA